MSLCRSKIPTKLGIAINATVIVDITQIIVVSANDATKNKTQ